MTDDENKDSREIGAKGADFSPATCSVGKAKTFSISLSGRMRAYVERQVATRFGGKRSAYFLKLVERDMAESEQREKTMEAAIAKLTPEEISALGLDFIQNRAVM